MKLPVEIAGSGGVSPSRRAAFDAADPFECFCVHVGDVGRAGKVLFHISSHSERCCS